MRGRIQETAFAPKFCADVTLLNAEFEGLAALCKRRRVFPPGQDLIYQGQTHQSIYILLSGWASSYKLLPDGTRQIIGFKIPGDFLGFRSVLFRHTDHYIEPITEIVASEVLASDLIAAFSGNPQLATAVLWATSRDEAMVAEQLVSVGRRDSIQRTAHLLLELGARLTLVGLGNQSGYACPLSQYLLADALGLSAVHVNRVLRQLREDGLLTFKNGMVTFDNFDRLVERAGFDLTYLDQSGPLLH